MSFLLYAMLAIAVVGVVGAHPTIDPELFPAFSGFAVDNGNGIQYLFPILFTTVACGAISGFHSLGNILYGVVTCLTTRL